MMNIVFVSNTSWFLYNFCQSLLRAVKAEGHDVYVLTPRDQSSLKFQAMGMTWLELSMHQTSKNPLRECLTLWRLSRQLHAIRPDVVLTFTIKCNLYVGFVKMVSSFEQIATLAGLGEGFTERNVWNFPIRGLYKIALKHARKVFFQNDDDCALFLRQRLLAPEQAERIPGLGVNLAHFTPSAQSKNNGTRIFLIFGRLLQAIGYGLFLEAARQIRQERPSQAEFWVLGIQDRSRKDSLDLFRHIQAFHQQRIITYFPAVDDVRPVLRQADVIVLPSEYNEGVPASLLEAMACSKPIITTNWKGCKETVEQGKNGYLIEKGNLESLKAALLRCLDADDATLMQMGAAGRKKAECEFDEQMIISKYVAELNTCNLLASQRGTSSATLITLFL